MRRSRAALAARTDPGEREDVVGEGREDRVPEEVLLRAVAVEVPGAVRRPPRPDEEWHDRQLVEPDLLQLRGDLPLLDRVQRHLPLIEQGGRLVVGEVLPVTRRGRILTGRDVRVPGEVR